MTKSVIFINLQLNDWPIERFTIIVATILISFVGLTFLEFLVPGIYIAKVVLGLIIVSFIPGSILLRILKLHNQGQIKSLLFSIGLSMVYLMILGVFVCILYPFLGISKPLSFNPLIITIITSLIVFLSFAFIIDRKYVPVNHEINFSDLLNPIVLFSFFVLFLGVLGVCVVNFYDNNLILMVFILLISFVPILITFKNIPSKFYPIIIFLVSLALLYHVTLFSNFLVGSDIFSEYYFANLVSTNQIWNPTLNHQLNSVLSIVLLPAIYKTVCGIDIVIYFKYVSPFFFSLVPLALYHIYETGFKGGLNKKDKFLAVFLVISLWYFYAMVTGVARQQSAELFLVLLLMIIFSDIKVEERLSYNCIFVLFSLALIFSQYSLANLFLYFIIIYLILNFAFKRTEKNEALLIGLNYVILFFILTFSWNMYIANGTVFLGIVTMGNTIVNSFSDIFTPQVNVSVNIATSTSINLLHTVYRYIYYFIIVCFAVGGLVLLKNLISHSKNKISIPIIKRINILRNIKIKESKNELYEILAFSNYSLLGLYLIVPFIGYQLGFDRVFHITTLLLAPYFIVGFKVILGIIPNIKKILFKRKETSFSHEKIVAIALCVILLFNSGIIFELTHDPFPNSVPLSFKNINNPTDIEKNKGNMYLKVQVLTDSELKSAQWMQTYYDPKLHTLYTTFGTNEFAVYGLFTPYSHVIQLNSPGDASTKIYKGYYYYNLISKIIGYEIEKPSWKQEIVKNVTPNETASLNQLDKIYTSTGDDIYIINNQ